MIGTLIRGVGGVYYAVDSAGRECVLRARGKLRRDHMVPVAGDRIEMTPGQAEAHGWLERVLDRSSWLARPPVANLELLILTIAPVPEPDMLLVDRLMIIARRAGIECLICVNKSDIDPSLGEAVRAEYAGSRADVETVSALHPDTLTGLREKMEGRLCCFAGQSGVGKSTVLSALLGRTLKTGEISVRTERGKHTTRHSELLMSNGLRVLDTPGFSLLALENMPPETVREAYPEFIELNEGCRFNPCLHDREPGCAVREALQPTAMAGRYDRYRVLLEEARAAWKERYK